MLEIPLFLISLLSREENSLHLQLRYQTSGRSLNSYLPQGHGRRHDNDAELGFCNVMDVASFKCLKLATIYMCIYISCIGTFMIIEKNVAHRSDGSLSGECHKEYKNAA